MMDIVCVCIFKSISRGREIDSTMNKEKYILAKEISWAKHIRNCDIGKRAFSKLRRRSFKKFVKKIYG